MKHTIVGLFMLGLICRLTADPVDHRLLQFSEAVHTLKLLDVTQNNNKLDVVVTWSLRAPQVNKKYHEYYIDIALTKQGTTTPPDASKPLILSMYTLGIQTAEHATIIEADESRDGGVVKFVGSETPPGTNAPKAEALNAPRDIYAAGVALNPKTGKYEIVANGIYFVELSGATTGKYRLKVREVSGRRFAKTGWLHGTVGEGHANEPPRNPPD